MIPVYEPDLSGKEREYLLDAFDSSWISSRGAYIDRFEAALRELTGAKHVALVSNGTTALHLALHCLNLGPGDEVIVPSLTYVASVNTIAQTGATPVFADSRMDDWLIDPAHVETLITPRTRAIMPVPLYGAPCDMDALRAIADRHGLVLIDDCAEALGSYYRGRHVGSLSEVSTYSFFGNKTVTTGEGGAVATDDPELFARMLMVKGQGQDPARRYWHTELGFNYRMTNLCAAIGLAQIERVHETLARKRQIAARYRANLAGSGFTFQTLSPDVVSSEWLISLLAPADADRDLIGDRLAQAGVETRPLFFCAHTMPHHRREGLVLPAAEEISRRGLSLPSHPTLSDAQIDEVCAKLTAALN